MFLDELTLNLKAGRGGNGVVRWLHEKGKEFGGPSGGDGGRGGHIYANTVRDIAALLQYRHISKLKAQNGASGQNKSRHGRDGEDFVINLPLGSLVTNKETGEVFELITEGERVLLLTGGRGGWGNEHFKSSVNRNPTKWTEGRSGEEADFHIELQLIADIGLVGLPNAGKTSLLNALTHADAKVGHYAFTTLEPNLGECYGRIIADIPGLIEGASVGKGLGDKFLRHIRRTNVLFHCVSLDNENLALAYNTVREELGRYDEILEQKPEWIILTKSDIALPETITRAVNYFKRLGRSVYIISVLDDESIKILRDAFVGAL